jgi:DNA-binding GntR family transcriptional regulator
METSAASQTTRDRVGDVRAELRRRILHWEYGPGARLIEENLSNEFGVSRAVVREALSQLQAAGFVRKVRHKGYSVCQPDVREIKELYEVRQALELYVTGRLARRRPSVTEIDALDAIWDESTVGPVDETELLAERDRTFHEAIFEAYGNQMLLGRIREINDRIEVFRRIDFSRGESIDSVRRRHHAIVEALAHGDEGAAVSAMTDNIEHAMQHVEEALKEMLMRAFARVKAESQVRG